MAHSPEFTYGRLLAAADIARKLGAQVMGLGAFTKVVGDAGVTVAKRAPLPVTTGNSYSASAALWAAHEAVDRLGLLERDEHGRIRGRAMVVGATGAIGSVCARLLALASDELWLVSPESAKLLALKHEIELPGQVGMKDIGLPPGVVYACLAETIVLALEGRYETFTVGRSIEWAKVKEIYRLGLKHGMRLAAISGVNGVFTDDDIARVRELALERRGAVRA
jgi:predicted amino acid dehydrogenase